MFPLPCSYSVKTHLKEIEWWVRVVKVVGSHLYWGHSDELATCVIMIAFRRSYWSILIVLPQSPHNNHREPQHSLFIFSIVAAQWSHAKFYLIWEACFHSACIFLTVFVENSHMDIEIISPEIDRKWSLYASASTIRRKCHGTIYLSTSQPINQYRLKHIWNVQGEKFCVGRNIVVLKNDTFFVWSVFKNKWSRWKDSLKYGVHGIVKIAAADYNESSGQLNRCVTSWGDWPQSGQTLGKVSSKFAL